MQNNTFCCDSKLSKICRNEFQYATFYLLIYLFSYKSWKGVTGVAPSSLQMKDAITKHDLFM